MTDFKNLTPCGGNCTGCKHFQSKSCAGCRSNGGKCVSMWEDRCAIFECCEKHDAYFCGVCDDFPCEWLKHKLAEWDYNGIEKLRALADEYVLGKDNYNEHKTHPSTSNR